MTVIHLIVNRMIREHDTRYIKLSMSEFIWKILRREEGGGAVCYGCSHIDCAISSIARLFCSTYVIHYNSLGLQCSRGTELFVLRQIKNKVRLNCFNFQTPTENDRCIRKLNYKRFSKNLSKYYFSVHMCVCVYIIHNTHFH